MKSERSVESESKITGRSKRSSVKDIFPTFNNIQIVSCSWWFRLQIIGLIGEQALQFHLIRLQLLVVISNGFTSRTFDTVFLFPAWVRRVSYARFAVASLFVRGTEFSSGSRLFHIEKFGRRSGRVCVERRCSSAAVFVVVFFFIDLFLREY